MNLIKSIRLYLVALLFASISFGAYASKLDRAITFVKDIYTLEYLNGPKGKYRNASMLKKIVKQPGRALTTAVVYGLSAYTLKKLYDLAEKQGVFDAIKTQVTRQQQEEDLQAYRNRQRVLHEREKALEREHERELERAREQERQREVVHQPAADARPIAPRPGRPIIPNQERPNIGRLNNVPIANPHPGRQLHVRGIPDNLPGFYHMHSNMPWHLQEDDNGEHLGGPCGIHAAWNMAQVEAHATGRHINAQEFERELRAVLPNLAVAHHGLTNDQVERIVDRLHLSPVTVLSFDDNDNIQLLGHQVEYDDPRDVDNLFVAAANRELDRIAGEFRRTQGVRVAHFLCGIPGHWIAISVVRNEQGAQAMYLYDNLNNRPHEVDHMRRHIENIYRRFF